MYLLLIYFSVIYYLNRANYKYQPAEEDVAHATDSVPKPKPQNRVPQQL